MVIVDGSTALGAQRLQLREKGRDRGVTRINS